MEKKYHEKMKKKGNDMKDLEIEKLETEIWKSL